MQTFCTVLRPKNCVVQRLIPVFHSSYTLSTIRKIVRIALYLCITTNFKKKKLCLIYINTFFLKKGARTTIPQYFLLLLLLFLFNLMCSHYSASVLIPLYFPFAKPSIAPFFFFFFPSLSNHTILGLNFIFFFL